MSKDKKAKRKSKNYILFWYLKISLLDVCWLKREIERYVLERKGESEEGERERERERKREGGN